MEKLHTLGLILLGLVVFIWRMIRKMRETAQQEQRERPAAPSIPLPSTSFDDLLKQMQKQNDRGNGPTARPTTPAGRPVPNEQAAPARTLERPAVRPISQERRATNVSLEKTVAPARRNTGLDHAPADNPLRRPRPTAPAARRGITDRLLNPAELRDAFILSEVLKRKFE